MAILEQVLSPEVVRGYREGRDQNCDIEFQAEFHFGSTLESH